MMWRADRWLIDFSDRILDLTIGDHGEFKLTWLVAMDCYNFNDTFLLLLIPNHKREATDRASRKEAKPTIEAMTDLVISERRFLTKSRNSSMFLGKANRNPCVRYSQTRSIGFNWGECAGWNIKMILLGNRSLLTRWQPAWSTYMRRRISGLIANLLVNVLLLNMLIAVWRFLKFSLYLIVTVVVLACVVIWFLPFRNEN